MHLGSDLRWAGGRLNGASKVQRRRPGTTVRLSFQTLEGRILLTNQLIVDSPAAAYANDTAASSPRNDTPPQSNTFSESTPTAQDQEAISTTTLVMSSTNPAKLSLYSQTVLDSGLTFYAFVQPASGTSTPLGSVQFQVDGASFGDPVPLVNGRASSPLLYMLSVSRHTVTATYISSNDDFAGSVGTLIGGQNVLGYNSVVGSTISITVSPSSTEPGAPITFKAHASSATSNAVPPDGPLQFQVDGQDFGPILYTVNGVATFTTTELAPGQHTITARFGGDGQKVVGSKTGDSAPLYSAESFPGRMNFIAIDQFNNLFISQSGTNSKQAGAIIKFNYGTGLTQIHAGAQTPGNGGDGGPALDAQLSNPGAVALDTAGNLYFIDTPNNSIRVVYAATGIIETIAGTGTAGFSGDGGPARSAQFNNPKGLVIDDDGNLYLADTGNHRIRRIDAATGIISTIAGTGVPGYNGDGIPATSAMLREPNGLALDSDGNLYVADTLNQEVRKIDRSTGLILRIAGRRVLPGPGDIASNFNLSRPTAVAVSRSGDVYLGDGNLIYKVDIRTGKISQASTLFSESRITSMLFDENDTLYVLAPGGSGFSRITKITFPARIEVQETTSFSTTTTLAATPFNPRYGEVYTIFVTVSTPGSTGVIPTGMVQLELNGSNYGQPVPLIGGIATFSQAATMDFGTYTVTAKYLSGSNRYLESEGALGSPLVISEPELTSTAIVDSPATSQLGQAVTFTAVVKPSYPSVLPPLGSVQFLIDGTPLGSPVPLVNGQATSIPIDTLSTGRHIVTPVYLPASAHFQASSDFTWTLDVSPAAFSFSVSDFFRKVVYGQLSSFSASLTPVAPETTLPDGFIQFMVDGVPFGDPVPRGPLNGGSSSTFSQETYTLSAGLHQISARYLDLNGNLLGTATLPEGYAVARAPLFVTADDQSRTYGSTNPSFTYQFSGFVNGDTPESLSTPVIATSTANTASQVGKYRITLTGATSPNYQIAFGPAWLTVTPAPLTITANNLTMAAGTDVPTLTASYLGLVNGDTPDALDVPALLSTPANGQSAPGVYPIDISGASDPNYAIQFISGTLTVTSGTGTESTHYLETDFALYYRQPNSRQGVWFVPNSTLGSGTPFGSSVLDVPVQGDFDGDGQIDLALYRPSTAQWFIAGQAPISFGWANVDIPVPGDYDHLGRTQIALYRPTTGEWFIAGHDQPISFGGPNLDIPVPADYDGVGHTQIALYRPSTGEWFIAGHDQPISFGGRRDIPIPSDYEGTGKAQLAVFRPSTMQWFVAGSSQFNGVSFGGAGDIPAPVHFSDGRSQRSRIAVYRPASGEWFIAGLADPISYGGPNMVPANAPYPYRAVIQAAQSRQDNLISAFSIINTTSTIADSTTTPLPASSPLRLQQEKGGAFTSAPRPAQPALKRPRGPSGQNFWVPQGRLRRSILLESKRAWFSA